MFNKSNDPLDGLGAEVKKILAERTDLLGIIANAESKVAHSQSELAAARERVAQEEYDNSQREGGLAVASKAIQQALAEAELQVKSAQYRLQGLQARLKPIEEKLLMVWAAIQKYHQDFIYSKIEALSQEWNETLKACVRMIHKTRVFGHLWPKPAPRGLRHPGAILHGLWIAHPFTHRVYVQNVFVREGDRMVDSTQHPELEPEAVALRDALAGTKERVMRLGAALKEAGLNGIDLKAQGGGEEVKEEETHASE